MIRLEVMNRVCPKCGNGNWMRRIVGDESDDIGRLNVKCLNCLSYFNEDDLSGVVKQCTGIKTNADRIRAMSDEELAYFISSDYYVPHCPDRGGNDDDGEGGCEACWLRWLRKEASE